MQFLANPISGGDRNKS